MAPTFHRSLLWLALLMLPGCKSTYLSSPFPHPGSLLLLVRFIKGGTCYLSSQTASFIQNRIIEMSPSRDMGCKCRRTGCQFAACIRGRKLSRETAGIRCLLTSSSLGCRRPGPLEFRLRGHVPPLSYGQLSAIVSP